MNLNHDRSDERVAEQQAPIASEHVQAHDQRRHGSTPAKSQRVQNRRNPKFKPFKPKGDHLTTQRSNFGAGDTHTEEGQGPCFPVR